MRSTASKKTMSGNGVADHLQLRHDRAGQFIDIAYTKNGALQAGAVTVSIKAVILPAVGKIQIRLRLSLIV